MKVKDVMTVAVGDVVAAEEGDSLTDVAKLLSFADIGALVILGPHGPRGIMTERDLVRAVGEGLDLDETQVRDLMTAAPVSIDEEADLDAAIDAMDEHSIRHLVVTADGRVTGILSVRDLLGAMTGRRSRT